MAVLAGCLLLLLSACSSFSPEEPPIADSTLVDVLAEMHLAGARVEVGYEVPPGMRDSILVHFGLDSTRFREAMLYYAERPEDYLTLYDHVLDRLSEMSH